MSIVKLAPAIKCYPWGGNKFQSKFGWNSEDVIAQGWLLSDQKDNESEVITGPFAGTLFSKYLQENPQSVGTLGEKYSAFPISVKMIDNQEPSVVQVNPDSERESIFYVVEAAPGAQIHFGAESDMTQEQLRAALSDGSIGKLLKAVDVKAGDVFKVEAGIPYAIGKDIQILDVLCEAPLKNFAPEEVVDSVRLTPVTQDFKIQEWVRDGQAKHALIGQTSVFNEELIQLNGSMSLTSNEASFEALIVLEGSAVITRGEETIHINPGDALYMSAASGPYDITGNVRFVQIHLI